MASNSRIQLENWIKKIESVNGNVLDIGGSQLPIIDRLNNTALRYDDYKILDLEVPHICKVKPDIVCDIQENIGPIIEYENRFDTVFCLEVTEYWYNPFDALKNIYTLMKDNGLLYISFHHIYPVHNPIKEDCLRYTPFGAISLLTKAGFEIIEETPRMCENVDLLNGFYSLEKMRPSKEFNKHNQVGSLIKALKI